MLDELLREKYEEFFKRFENKPVPVKRQVHYNSTCNCIKYLLEKGNTDETEIYKKLLISYFNEIENENFPTDKIFQTKIFIDYLLKVGSYLIKKKEFRTNANLYIQLLLGVFFDILAYYLTNDLINFYIPFFSVIMLLNGFDTRINAKKKKDTLIEIIK